MNKLHAGLLRARMLGDAGKVAALEAQIGEATRSAASAAAASDAAVLADHLPAGSRPSARTASQQPPPALLSGLPSSGGPEVAVIAAYDSRGMPLRSLQSGREAPLERADLKAGSRKGKHSGTVNVVDPSAPGARTGWLRGEEGGDGDVSMAELLRRERESGAGDLDRRLLESVTHSARTGRMAAGAFGGGSHSGADEGDFGLDDDVSALMSGKDSRLSGREAQKRDMQRAVAAHGTAERATASCPYCLEGGAMKRHCVVSLGEHSALMFPPGGQRMPGHMQIVPLAHVAAVTDAEEGTYDEINRFKAALHAMCAAGGEQQPLFLESALSFGARTHAVVDVVPLDNEAALDAPLFFRKAITDAEEWTTNAALLDTAGKGLRRVIPRGFPYFHVSWAGGGFVHPVEDAEEFPPDFGLSTAAGMAGQDMLFGRERSRGGGGRGGRGGGGGGGGAGAARRSEEGARASFERERQGVLAFLQEWEPFDFTQHMDGGDAASASSSSAAAAQR